ncbi:TPA: hypothetical protein EYP26_04115 [Candidatus Bathyarchaeota archaeon]|nr:hypothetical protein [Candidatus Bathyarchaeota archaeon]
MWLGMLSWWVVAGLIAAGAAAGGVTGYLMSRKPLYAYGWSLGYDPYWRRWVWIPVWYGV